MGKPLAKPDEIISIPDKDVLLYVYFQYRKNAKVSLKEGHARLHIPILTSSGQKEKYLSWATQWVSRKIEKDTLLGSDKKRRFESGEVFRIMDNEYILRLEESRSEKRAAIKLVENQIFLSLPEGWEKDEKDLAARKLFRKLLTNAFYSDFVDRVMEINNMHFREGITAIRLKYNKSNWGSCSVKRNLNFSIRLLFAPMKVIDYVIIHELAHLLVMSHSHEFWKIVASKDPDYKQSEKWLRENDHSDFI
jgi:predicted metal-dependent hydrolase